VPIKSSYLGFPCKQCKHPLIALTIPRDAVTPTLKTAAYIRLQCPRCGHDDEYPAQEIARYEADQLAF
jgi:RNase P subunit RPR2